MGGGLGWCNGLEWSLVQNLCTPMNPRKLCKILGLSGKNNKLGNVCRYDIASPAKILTLGWIAALKSDMVGRSAVRQILTLNP